MAKATAVEQIDPTKKTSEIIGPMSDEATVNMALQDEKCFWNDQEFAHGEQVELGNECYECSFGRWLQIRGG